MSSQEPQDRQTVAMRADVLELKTDLLRELASKAELAGVRTEIADARGDVARLEARLIKWVVGTAVAVAAVVIGALSAILALMR